jgi:hypothetical protein
MEEPIIYSSKYAVLPTLEAYNELNQMISKIIGYPKNDTKIYAPEDTKVINEFYYMEIEGYLQEKYPDLIQGLELVDSLPEVINTEPVIE